MFNGKVTRRTILFVCFTLLVSIFAACSSNEPSVTEKSTVTQQSEGSAPNVMDKTKIVVYSAGSIKVREDDAKVKEAIEEKLLADTGLNLDLDFKPQTNEDFTQNVNLALAAGDQVDAICNYIGEKGLGVFINKPGLVKPLNDLIEDYGSNLNKVIPEESWKSITYNGSVMGIPSVNNKAIWGAVIRKDWLDELSLEVPTTLDELEVVMEAFKNKGDNIIPLLGYPWCIEWALLPGAYGINASFQYWVDPADNLLKPAYMNPIYKEVLKRMYKWVKNGWWDKDNNVRPWDDMLNKFISGQAGICLGYPEILFTIDVVIKPTKKANPEAEFVLLPALKGPEGKSGIMAQPIVLSRLESF